MLLCATLMSLLPAALGLPTDIEVFQQLHVEPHYTDTDAVEVGFK